jgi:non-specific serine/threonine protein kinase/serine/threonine-protein kinase
MGDGSGGGGGSDFRALDARLDELLDLTESERTARLAALRCSEPELAGRLESLLADHRAVEQGGFLSDPPTLPLPDLQGRRLGPYTFESLLGRGGMGEVWRAAQQEPVRRQVAIKVILHGMDTAQVVARFQAERQALALMQHDAVARVFEAGSTPEGRPFFVMEYVQGEPITEYCDRRRMGVAERLALFMRVCDGVQHAHRKGIIHRDLKPSNVLVTEQDGRALPKIIDFGIAKATAEPLTDGSLHTGVGLMLGTPEYMSPEQADSAGVDIDTRSDVYTLGVMLYKLLAGMPPFEPGSRRRGSQEEIRRRIREDVPRRPSARVSDPRDPAVAQAAAHRGTDTGGLRKSLRGELDWIVMKALEKDRERRYGSAADLAADLGRSLAGMPVTAGPPTAAYRARTFVRRHRLGVGLGVTALLGIAGVAVAMTVQSARLARERDRANREAETATRALDFLTTLFEVSDPSESRGSSVTAREILDRGAARIQSQLKDEPAVQAKLLMTLGDVYRSLGLLSSAQPLLERSLLLRRHLLGEENPETLESLNSLASLLQDEGKLSEAEPFFSQLFAARRRVLGEDHIDTLTAENNLALILQLEGKYAEAESLFRRTLEGYEKTLPADDSDILMAKNNLGLLLKEKGHGIEAEPYMRAVLDGCRRTMGNDHPHTLTAMNNMGLLMQSMGRLGDAESYFRECLDTRRRVLGPDHPLTLVSQHNLANDLRMEGRLDEAEGLLSDALGRARAKLGPEHPRTLGLMNTVAALRQSQGRLGEAETERRACLEARRRVLGADNPDTIDSSLALGQVLLERREPARAEPFLRDALARSGAVLGLESPMTLIAAAAVGEAEAGLGRFDEARRRIEATLETARRALPKGSAATGKVLCSYGRCLARAGKAADAEAAFTEARAIFATGEPVLVAGVDAELSALRSPGPGRP